MPTKIEWCDETWNPITGCTPISIGCLNCYASKMANRLRGRHGYSYVDPFKPATIHKDKLCYPLKIKRVKRFFVCSMGDFFHDEVLKFYNNGGEKFINEMWDVMASCPQHIFHILTKRTHNIEQLLSSLPKLNNLWLGTTVETQKQVERIEQLIPMRKYCGGLFVSCEPLLGPVDIEEWLDPLRECDDTTRKCIRSGLINSCQAKEYSCETIKWVIVGGETGPGSRPMETDWARSLREQCKKHYTPFFFKKHGSWWCREFGKRTSWRENHELDGMTWEQFPN